MTKIDRFIFFRLLTITFFVLAILIFIFVVIDFSENSDDFTDKGATIAEILKVYYLNYIPEMTRLVIPVAVFVACLIQTGQMADRSEIIAMRAAGVSLYRMLAPFLLFAIITTGAVSYLDGWVVPRSNVERFEFERTYLKKKSNRIKKNRLFRQNSENSLMLVNYFDPKSSTAFKVDLYEFDGKEVKAHFHANRMVWVDSTQSWQTMLGWKKYFNQSGYEREVFARGDTSLNVFPRDLARSSADVYRLTYPEIVGYLEALQRSGAKNIGLPQVQFYGRLAYPFSIIVVSLIGVALASVRRKGGKGVYIALGLAVSFLYLAFMKLSEPFGVAGTVAPELAAIMPHGFFFAVGIVLVITARK